MTKERIFSDVMMLDITRNLSGPLCSQMLGDLGAEIIKVEPPTGDDTRNVTFAGRRPQDEDFFHGVNRNKKSIVLNLREAKGRELLLKLAAQADVLLQNYGPGSLEGMGLGYKQVREVNPRIIYCSISGFGQTGPFKDRKAYDPIVTAMAGLLRRGGGPPIRGGGGASADCAAAFHAAFAIASALYGRQHTGKGQFIDIAMYDSLLPIMGQGFREYLATGNEVTQPARVPINFFSCKDGEYIYIIATQPQWADFCEAVEQPALAGDPRFRTNNDRRNNKDLLEEILAGIFATKAAREWDDILTAAGLPCGLLYSPAEMLKSEQVKIRGMVREVVHPVSGTIKVIGWPYHFSETPAEIILPPPLLGQHTEEILRERLGMTGKEIRRLLADNVVIASKVPLSKET